MAPSTSTPLVERIAIIGIGLIGSSLARVVRRDGLAGHIAVCARTHATLDTVRALGLADSTTTDPRQVVDGADMILLCTPLAAYADIAAAMAPGLKQGAIVTDVGSVKHCVIRDVGPLLPEGVHLVPAHPIAGTEHSGPEAGFAELFEGRYCVLTPPPGTDETAIERRLFPAGPPPDIVRPLPDWAETHLELRKKGLTLFLLWEEYKARFPEGYHYSRFCDLYRDWAKKLDLSMRQEHRAGEKMFVDYAGLTVPVYDHGTLREAQIFVAVLGASSYAYAEATWTQTLPDWTASHVRAFEYFGGVTEIIVPDNLLSGVTRPCRYEPGVNATYGDLLAHYRTVAIPARIKKPRDKAKVEAGVLLVDEAVAGHYDTVYVDLDGDRDFTDEKSMTRADPLGWRLLGRGWGDGCGIEQQMPAPGFGPTGQHHRRRGCGDPDWVGRT